MNRVPVLLAILAVLALGCRPAQAPESREASTDEIEIRIATARLAEVPNQIEVVGTLEPTERVILSAQTSGIVAETRVDFGDHVTKGGILGSLDSREFTLRVAAARAALKQVEAVLGKTRADHRRARMLFEEKVLAEENLDHTLAELRVAEANREAAATELAIAEKHLGDTRLLSPVDGYVAVRHVNVGEHVATNQPVVEIVVVDPLKLRVSIPERFAGSVKAGLTITLRLDSLSITERSGTISRIGADVDLKTRTLLVESTVANPDGFLKPGQFARAMIDLGTTSAVVVPRAAVTTFGGSSRVFVVRDDGSVASRAVLPGRDLGESVVLLEGLSADERVATSHLERLADGTRVRTTADHPI